MIIKNEKVLIFDLYKGCTGINNEMHPRLHVHIDKLGR